MNRKHLVIEVDYTSNINENDSAFISARYSDMEKGNKFLYRMGRSGTKGYCAGEMQFHDANEYSKFNDFAKDAINDFESTIKAIKSLKEIE